MFQKTFAVLAASIVVLCTSQIASAQVTATIDPTGSVCNGVPCSTSQTQTFSFRIVNGNTASFSMLSVIIAPPSDLNLDACYFLYGRWGNSGRGSLAIFLDSPQANNGNPIVGWNDGTDIANSQCTVKGSQMTQTPSGNDLIVTIPIVASNLMLGTYNIFLSPAGSWNFAQPNGYWQPIAQSAWPAPPTTSVFPGSGTGMNATFDVTLSSSGVGKSRALSKSLFIINQYASGVGACYAIYTNTNHKLIMLADSGNSIVSNGSIFLSTTPGPSQIASNSQCTMDLGQITYADPVTNDVSLHIPVQSFSTLFSNTGPQTKQVYSVPIDRAGQVPTTWPSTSNGTWVVATPDYSMVVTPAGSSIAYASSNIPVTYNVSVSPANGFNGKVTLSASGFPGGAKATFNPPEIFPGGTSLLTINTTAVRSAGNFTIIVTGQSGSLFRAAMGSQLSVQDFLISVSPAYGAISVPMSATVTQSYTLIATGLNGFNLPINSSLIVNGCSMHPVTANWPAQLSPGATVVGQISFLAHNIASPNCFKARGVANGVIKDVEIQVDFRTGNDYSVNISGPPILTVGTSATYSVTTPSVNGSAGNVSFAVGGLPAGVSYVIGASANGTTPIVLTATPGAAAGMFYFTVIGNNGPIVRSGQLQITIPTRSDFLISASPAKATPNWVTSLNVVVTGSQGFSTGVTLVPTGLPPGAVITPASQQVNGSGLATFVISTSNTPLGEYPIRITPNGTANKSITANLTISAPIPASMLTPAPGSNLANSANTFVWAAPVGATQVQFYVGSSVDGADLFSMNGTANATANCPDGSLLCQSSTVSTLPTGQNLIYATLNTLIDGTWNKVSYVYTKSATGLSLFASLTKRTPFGPSHYVVNNGLPHYWQFCLAPGPNEPCGNTADYDYHQLSSCNINGKPFVSTAGIEAPSPLVNETSPLPVSRFTLKFIALPSAEPGFAALQCAGNRPAGYQGPPPATFAVSLANAIEIFDGSPVISSIRQYEPETAGGPFYITIYGKNLGRSGFIDICPANANPCTTNAADMAADVYGQYTYWSVSQINALVTPNPVGNGAYALYDVIVRSNGANGVAFADPPLPTPGQPTGSSSNKKQVTMLPTKIFIIHGLSDSAASFTNLRNNLQNSLNTSRPGKFVVDSSFTAGPPSDCKSIVVWGERVATHVRQNITQGQRVAFVVHSMGGLMVRSLLSRNLLFAPSVPIGPSFPTPSGVVGLATLGTPHLGAPTEPDFDSIFFPSIGKCGVHLQEMQSLLGTYFIFPFDITLTLQEALAYSKSPDGTPFLDPLRLRWDPTTVNYKWLAMAGTACPSGTRFLNGPITGLVGNIANGCRDLFDGSNDGAVCRQSALAQYPAPFDIFGFQPTQRYSYSQFRHNQDMAAEIPGIGAVGPLMCGGQGNVGTQFLTNPSTDSELFLTLVGFLNAM